MISLDSLPTPGLFQTDGRSAETESSFYVRYGKRAFDVLFALVVITFILSWLLLITAICIRVDSSGPVFYIQRRTGKNGRKFSCLKLRTMHNKKQLEFQQTKKNDNRVTKVGRFLRKTNIDEMPQFINVLLGHMSVVGPRPHAVEHDAQFWNSFPEYKLRYLVKPGITGLAQVRGARGETETLVKMQHRVRYDLCYRDRQSFYLDVRICWWTVKSMVKGNVNAW